MRCNWAGNSAWLSCVTTTVGITGQPGRFDRLSSRCRAHAHLVGPIQRQHDRLAASHELEDQAQVYPQVDGVDHGDDQFRRRFVFATTVDHLERHLLVGRGRRQAVGARQFNDLQRLYVAKARHALLTLDGCTRVFRHALARAGQQVEQRRLAAVGVSDQRDAGQGVQRGAHAGPRFGSAPGSIRTQRA
jgi:hypothetical protein